MCQKLMHWIIIVGFYKYYIHLIQAFIVLPDVLLQSQREHIAHVDLCYGLYKIKTLLIPFYSIKYKNSNQYEKVMLCQW